MNGITFDSKREAERWQELQLLLRAGAITDLRRQVKYELSATKKIGGVTVRGCSYIADFVYRQNGRLVVEDAKGYKTAEYKIKRKWMADKYGVLIKET